jgi:hypothetical protein
MDRRPRTRARFGVCVFRCVCDPDFAVALRRALRVDALFDNVVNQVVGLDLVSAFGNDRVFRKLDRARQEIVTQLPRLGVGCFIAARPLEFEGCRGADDSGKRQLMFGELQVCCVAFDVAVFDVDDDVTRELPDAVFEVEIARLTFGSFDTDGALGQAQAAEHEHGVLAVVGGGIRIEGYRQPQVVYLRSRSGRQEKQNGGKSYGDISAHELGHEFPADVRLQFQSIVVE